MGQIIPLDVVTRTRAEGVFAAINIAARRMGFSDERAVILARAAKLRMLRGSDSAARVVSQETAKLRESAPRVLA